MLSVANVVGAILGPIVNKWVTIRPSIIAGMFVMTVFLGLIVLF